MNCPPGIGRMLISGIGLCQASSVVCKALPRKVLMEDHDAPIGTGMLLPKTEICSSRAPEMDPENGTRAYLEAKACSATDRMADERQTDVRSLRFVSMP